MFISINLKEIMENNEFWLNSVIEYKRVNSKVRVFFVSVL